MPAVPQGDASGWARRLEGRRAVVVGVGSVIGRACAIRLAHEGAAVLAVDPDGDVAAEVARFLGETAHAHVAGLTGRVHAASVADRCIDLWGGLDILVDCGSAMEVWPEDEDTLERFAETMSVNVAGPLAYALALAPTLAASPAAAIVFLGSIDGIHGNAHVPAYSVGKGALITLTHVLAQRLGPQGIRVNCIAAAGIAQNGSGVAPLGRVTGDAALAVRMTPLGRMPSPEEIASVALFFASDDSSYVTATVLPVDGGRIGSTPGTW